MASIDYSKGSNIKLSGLVGVRDRVGTVTSGSSYDVSQRNDIGKVLVATTGATFPFTFNLPDSIPNGWKVRISVDENGNETIVSTPQTIILPTGDTPASLRSSQKGAFLELTYRGGNLWAITDASGRWTDGGSPEKGWYWDGIFGLTFTGTSATLVEAYSGHSYVADGGGDDPVVFTLPETPADGTSYSFQLFGSTRLRLTASGSDQVYIARYQNTSMETQSRSSAIKLVYDSNQALWMGVGGSGRWYDPTNLGDQFLFDGDNIRFGVVIGVSVLNLISDADMSGADPVSPTQGDAYIVDNWLTQTDNDLVEWDGSSWVVIIANKSGSVQNGVTGIICGDHGTAGGTFLGAESQIYKYDSNYGWYVQGPAGNALVVVKDDGSVYSGQHWAHDKNATPVWTPLDIDPKTAIPNGLGADYTFLPEDNGKWFASGGSGSALTFTLPEDPKPGWRVRVGVGGGAGPRRINLVFQGSNRLLLPGPTLVSTWQCNSFTAFIELLFFGNDTWIAVNANGYWADDLDSVSTAHQWDGTVFGAALGNIPEFGTSGTIIDSGTAESDVTLKDGSRAFTNPVGGATPTDAAHLTTKDYVDGKVQGLDWQDSVQHNISYLKTGSAGAPTGGSGETSGEKCLNTNDGKLYTYTASWDVGVAVSTDERFIFKDDGTGSGFSDGTTPTSDDKIREYNGSTFDETTPNEGFAVWIEDIDKQYNFNGTAWVTFGSTVTHNNTSGLQGGSSTERYHLTSSEHTGTGSGDLVRENSPTIVTPTIASMTNAQHNHADAAGGGTVAHSATTGQTANDHHSQVHDIDGSDHNGVSGAVEDNLVAFDANGKPKDSGIASDLGRAYGEMGVSGGAAYTINTQSAWHAYDGFSADEVLNTTFVAGAIGTDISAYATYDAGATTKVTTTGAHGLTAGQFITITNTTNYNDVYEVLEIVDANNFTIDKAWDTNDDAQGTYARGDSLKIDTDYGGKFKVSWWAGGSIVTSAATCEFGIFVNKTLDRKIPRKFSNAADVGAFSGGSIVTAAEGDVIWFGLLNTTNANDIDIDEMSFTVNKV